MLRSNRDILFFMQEDWVQILDMSQRINELYTHSCKEGTYDPSTNRRHIWSYQNANMSIGKKNSQKSRVYSCLRDEIDIFLNILLMSSSIKYDETLNLKHNYSIVSSCYFRKALRSLRY